MTAIFASLPMRNPLKLLAGCLFLIVLSILAGDSVAHADAAECRTIYTQIGEFEAMHLPLLDMLKKYEGEDQGKMIWNVTITQQRYFKVKYLKPEERRDYLAHAHHSMVVNADGQLWDTTAAPNGEALYVVDREGDFYIANIDELGVFHHSSLSAGGPVWIAGTIVIKNGIVEDITNDSGHYLTPNRSLETFVAALRAKGVTVKKMSIRG